MNSLEKARQHIKTNLDKTDSLQPVFHLTSGIGWINDPNGFSVYKGEYHLFFQHYPYDTVWGSMHWGHARTRDFIHWELLPVALAPGEEYDASGCFSGSAIELEDGRQLIMYTGVTPKNYNTGIEKRSDEQDDYQNQCIAIGDGINYEKLADNPILLASTIPEGGSLVDFRDPKIWKEGEKYYAVISNRPADRSGEILLYKSKDAIHWSFVSVLISNHDRYGKMWECPDLFTLDGHDVLLVSPMEMESVELEYHPGHGTIAFLGNLDKNSHTFKDTHNQAIDYGTDFYSTQSLQTPDGRRVMIAWMNNWATIEMRPKEFKFSGQMTFPRELHVKNNRLIQNPVQEIEKFRRDEIIYKNILLSGQEPDEYAYLDGVKGRILDMTLEITPSGKESYKRFELQLAQNEKYHFLIQYLPHTSVIRIDRGQCGSRMDVIHHRDFRVRSREGKLKLRVLMDKYSVELFVNDGEQAASCLFYTDLAADGIRFHADGEVTMDISKYSLLI